MTELLDGLRLYQPQTFLIPANYTLSLLRQSQADAAITLCIGVYLLIFGLPIRRITAAFLGGAFFWIVGGCIAMTQHISFTLLAFGLGSIGLISGFLLPRLTLAFISAILLATCMRALFIALDIPLALEMPFEVFAGAFAVFFLIGLIAWFSWIALANALLGATLIVYSFPPLIGAHDPGHVIMGGALTFLTLAGVTIQMRQGVRPRPPWLRRKRV